MPQIKLEAKPHPIAVDTAKAALIVVDMQNDFGSKGGLFDHAGVDITSIQKVVPATARAIAAARKTGITVIFLKMGFRPDLSDMGSDDAPNRVRHVHFGAGQPMKTPDGREGRFLVRDTGVLPSFPSSGLRRATSRAGRLGSADSTRQSLTRS